MSIIDPREIPLYREVMRAHRENTPDGQHYASRSVQQAQRVLGLDKRPLTDVPMPNLGASVVLAPLDQNIQVLRVQTGQERIAEGLTLVCQAKPVGSTFQVGSFMPPNQALIRGNVTWGIGQATYEAFFDMHRGTVLNIGAASFVIVNASYDLVRGPPATPTDPNFQISCGLGYGDVGFRTAPGTFTGIFTIASRVLPAPSGGAAVIQVPPFAKSFSLMSDSATPLLVATCTTAAALSPLLATYEYTNRSNTSHHYENLFAIPNGTEQIQIQNNEITALPQGSTVSIIFTLDF